MDKLNKKGETLAESLVSFLIACICAIAIASAVNVSRGLIEKGESLSNKILNDIYKDEEFLKTGLSDNDIKIVKIDIISDGNIYGSKSVKGLYDEKGVYAFVE